MTEKVHYGTLLPHEFQQRLDDRPVAYLPIGTLEWHGPHNALGADYIQSGALFERAAKRFGGIVFPPIWVAPDHNDPLPAGPPLTRIDIAEEKPRHERSTGNCFWVPQALFLALVEATLAQAAAAGFKCVVADGHGPSRRSFALCADAWEEQFGIALVSVTRDLPEVWRSQLDHAGRNETSIMLAVAPDLVDMSTLSEDRAEWPPGVAGEDPRDATADYGEECIEASLTALGRRLDEIVPREA